MTDQEQELWKAFQGGSTKAFEEILEIFYRPMFDYGTRFQKDHDQLSDDIHDLFLSLWDRRAFLKPVENLKLYLFAAVRNQVFRQKKKATWMEELSDEQEYEQHQEIDYAEIRIIHSELTDERLSRINAVMGKLSKRQQEILHLRFFENLSNSQIAEILNISEPATYNLLSKSLKMFRKYWNLHFIVLLFLFIVYKFLYIN
jgi:RNA polymerase sigma factor (sigma-70 family)